VLPWIRADAVISLLCATPCLVKLTTFSGHRTRTGIFEPFPLLENLEHLSISDLWGQSESTIVSPGLHFHLTRDSSSQLRSENFLVAIAAATRTIEKLSLDRITCLRVHTSKLEGVYPCPPLGVNDEDIPDDPPQGGRILTLRTVLGHPSQPWTTIPVACPTVSWSQIVPGLRAVNSAPSGSHSRN
jgi:hypothetical protein